MKTTLIAGTQYRGENTTQHSKARDDQMQGTDAEKLAEFAGRLCYESYGKGRDSTAFHENIVESKHFNVAYHAHFSLLIEDISRNTSHELIRHHVGFSPTQRSTRYVDERDSLVVDHPAVTDWFNETPADEAARNDVEHYAAELVAYEKAWRGMYSLTVESMMRRGADRKTAQGAAARYLPHGIATDLVWTGNLYAFMDMTFRRMNEHVDAEFRLLAKQMVKVLRPEAPTYFNKFFGREND